MKLKQHSSQPFTEAVSRRTALERMVAAGLGLAALSASTAESATSSPAPEPEFVPENDYPYFDYQPEK